MQRRPAEPGSNLADIETPALVVDLDAFTGNLERMADAAAAGAVRLRPHAKSHKCPDIARLQIARGAVGVCCQKTDEAEAFVDAGIADVLVTNEVIAPAKLSRLAQLARRARIGVLCDANDVVPRLSAAAIAADVELDVYVEVDVGAARCGVAPGVPAALLAQEIAASSGLRFAGLHCYHGGAQHLRSPDERQAAIGHATRAAVASSAACVAAGLAVPIITGAGTGTFEHEMGSGVWNELQPGSYLFMDVDYARNTPAAGALRFAQSLFVQTTIMSVPTASRAICDAGLKSMAFDSGLPVVADRPGARYAKASDEHGVLDIDAGVPAHLGEQLRLVPGHCDPTVNLYDWLVGVRGSRVECLWPIARGTLG
jgi:D-serine deaminase-like pyridoxal phosphate-dependent protein